MTRQELKQYLMLEFRGLQEKYPELQNTRLIWGKGTRRLGFAQIHMGSKRYNSLSTQERIDWEGIHTINVTVAQRVMDADLNEIYDTLLHEVAHILDYIYNGFETCPAAAHGPTWKEWARKVGADPTRYSSIKLKTKYELCCRESGKVLMKAHRAGKRIQAHLKWQSGSQFAAPYGRCTCHNKPVLIKINS